MFYLLLKPLAILILKSFFKLKVYGKDNLPRDKGFILVSNHLSLLDPIILGVACPRKLNFMAKKELFKNRLFSYFIRSLGAFPVRRNYHDFVAIREALRRLKEGKVLVLFPEGTRLNSKKRLYPGAGLLALKSSVPIIPSYIKGSDKALAPGSNFVKRANLKVCFGPPFIIKYKDYREAVLEIMEKINLLKKEYEN